MKKVFYLVVACWFLVSAGFVHNVYGDETSENVSEEHISADTLESVSNLSPADIADNPSPAKENRQVSEPLTLDMSDTEFDVTASFFPHILEIVVGETGTFDLTLNIPEGYYISHQVDYFAIHIQEEEGFLDGRVFYPYTDVRDDSGVVKYSGSVTLTKEIELDKNVTPGLYEIKFDFYWQICDVDGICFMPEETTGVIVVNVIPNQETSVPMSDILKNLLLAFIGGIILNLMPCVLPVLTIRAFAMVKQSEHSRKAIMTDGILYTLGIMTSFVILATIITIIKLSGEMVGWAFQFQNPGFVIVLLTMMYVFSLSLFDAFTISLPGMNTASKMSGKKGLWGSFLTGCFAVLIATPCTAPILGVALGFAFSQPPAIIFAIFLMVGLGLGFPFLLIGIFPKCIKILPKPGEWMNIFKEILGFLLIGFAISLVSTINVQMGGEFIVKNLLPFALCLRIAVWLYGRFVTPLYHWIVQWIAAVIVILLVAGGGQYFVANAFKPVEQRTEIELKDDFWTKFDEDTFYAAREQGLPVFVDFTAEYCTQCKINARQVMDTQDIRQAFIDKNVVMLKGDFTRGDKLIFDWLQKYQAAGVPLDLLFMPNQNEPIKFPTILTKRAILDALDKIE